MPEESSYFIKITLYFAHMSVEVPPLDCITRALMQNSVVFYSKGLQPPDLMHDDLRWSGCKNNRNKVQNKCNVFESSWKHPPSVERWSSLKLVPGTKKAGDSYSRACRNPWQRADSLIILHLTLSTTEFNQEPLMLVQGTQTILSIFHFIL